MAKRRPLSNRKSRKIFKKGSRIHAKNAMPTGGFMIMRGGMRL